MNVLSISQVFYIFFANIFFDLNQTNITTPSHSIQNISHDPLFDEYMNNYTDDKYDDKYDYEYFYIFSKNIIEYIDHDDYEYFEYDDEENPINNSRQKHLRGSITPSF